MVDRGARSRGAGAFRGDFIGDGRRADGAHLDRIGHRGMQAVCLDELLRKILRHAVVVQLAADDAADVRVRHLEEPQRPAVVHVRCSVDSIIPCQFEFIPSDSSGIGSTAGVHSMV